MSHPRVSQWSYELLAHLMFSCNKNNINLIHPKLSIVSQYNPKIKANQGLNLFAFKKGQSRSIGFEQDNFYHNININKVDMYQIKLRLQPFVKEYNKFINGDFLTETLQYKSKYCQGNDYVSKVYRSASQQAAQPYYNIVSQVNDPTYFGFIRDNFVRLFALNAVERLIVAYQTAQNIPRAGKPSTYNLLFTEIMNDGAFRGTLKGLTFNILQASLVLYPSVYLTNTSKAQNKHMTFVSTYMALDFLLTPIESIKNYMYAHTHEPKTLRQALSQTVGSYRGALSKAIFNIAFASALFETTQKVDNYSHWWLLAGFLYPLNSMKAVLQTGVMPNRVAPYYRGVVPFMALNYFFCWQLSALYGEQKVEAKREEVSAKIRAYSGKE